MSVGNCGGIPPADRACPGYGATQMWGLAPVGIKKGNLRGFGVDLTSRRVAMGKAISGTAKSTLPLPIVVSDAVVANGAQYFEKLY